MRITECKAKLIPREKNLIFGTILAIPAQYIAPTDVPQTTISLSQRSQKME